MTPALQGGKFELYLSDNFISYKVYFLSKDIGVSL